MDSGSKLLRPSSVLHVPSVVPYIYIHVVSWCVAQSRATQASLKVKIIRWIKDQLLTKPYWLNVLCALERTEAVISLHIGQTQSQKYIIWQRLMYLA